MQPDEGRFEKTKLPSISAITGFVTSKCAASGKISAFFLAGAENSAFFKQALMVRVFVDNNAGAHHLNGQNLFIARSIDAHVSVFLRVA